MPQSLPLHKEPTTFSHSSVLRSLAVTEEEANESFSRQFGGTISSRTASRNVMGLFEWNEVENVPLCQHNEIIFALKLFSLLRGGNYMDIVEFS